MRAAVLTAPRSLEVRDVPVPTPAPGDALVAVHRVGLCGTDVEFFEGTMSYLHSGHARFPLRLGHEWMGVVEAVGDRADETWVGRAVIGGLLMATLFTLFFVPAVYAIVYSKRPLPGKEYSS